jgi:DNA mismatch repair protein MutL
LAGPASLPVDAYVARAKAVLGKEIAADLTPVFAQGPDAQPGEGPGYRLFGLVTPPSKTRPNRNCIYLAVNGRPVKDRTLTTALINAYRNLLPPGRFPAGVLYLLIPGPEVDINVHPTKAEVRFRTPGLIFSLLHHAIRKAFATPSPSTDLAPEPPELILENRRTPRQQTFDLWQGEQPQAAPDAAAMTAQRIAEAMPRFARSEPHSTHSSDSHSATIAAEPRSTLPAATSSAVPAATPDLSVSQNAQQPLSSSTIPSPRPTSRSSQPAPCRLIGQAGGSYIVVEDECGIRLIDQHALHERILFENLMQSARRKTEIPRQGLLLPETIELTPTQAAAFGDPQAQQILQNLGYDLDSFGPRTIAVHAVPALVRSPNAASFVCGILDTLSNLHTESDAQRLDLSLLYEKAAYVLSCKGAIKAGERLTIDQMQSLLNEFHREVGSLQFTCPHGRPIAVELCWDELERKVARR